MDLEALAALVAAFAAARDRLDTAVEATLTAELGRFDGWYDTAAITTMATRAAGQVQAGQRQTAALTDAYLARAAVDITGRPMQPVGSIDVTGLRQGVASLAAVYGRVADQYRYDVSRDIVPDVAAARARERALVMAQTDTDLAMRAQAHKFMVVRKVSGYRRIVHPELSEYGSCGLCISAADRVYHREQLLPLHDRCKCTVLPIINDIDPGLHLNDDALKALYEAAGSTKAAALKRVRAVVHEHGELGPVLRQQGQHFRGPAQVRRAREFDQRALTHARELERQATAASQAGDRDTAARLRAEALAARRQAYGDIAV